jgi:hypothetical protein
MLRPLARGLAVSALTAGIAFAAAPAFAATTDAPVAGTAACTNLVNVQSDVIAARATLQGDVNTLNADLRATPVVDATVAADRARVTQDQAHLDVVVGNVTASLCTGTTTSTPATVTPAPTTDPTTPPVVPHTRSQAFIDDEIAGLNCDSTNVDLQRIDQQIAARQAAGQEAAEAVSALNAKLAGLNCTAGAVTPKAAAQTARDCGCVTVTEAPVVTNTDSGQFSAKTVVPSADNGSVATTSGSEVTDVPQGSVQTGAV